MKTFKISGLLLAAALVIFSACKKKNDPVPVQKSKTDFLTASNWKLKSRAVSPAIGGISNLYLACNEDDITKFNADGSALIDPGDVKCDASEEVRNLNWLFGNANQTKIIATAPGKSLAFAFEIVELSESKLVLTYKMEEQGTTYTHTETFSH